MRTLSDYARDMEFDGDGALDMACSDLGITYREAFEASKVAVERFVNALDGQQIELGNALGVTFVQGVVAALAFARKRTDLTWRA